MPKTRYFKTPEQLTQGTSQNQDVTTSVVTNIVIDYQSDPEAVAECVPPHLTPNQEGLVTITLSNVAVKLGPLDFEFGSVSVNIPCEHEGEQGSYCLHMYMNQETPVVAGREIYGEPKKIAEIEFAQEKDALDFTITRHFCPFIQFKGKTVGEPLPVGLNEQTMFVYKAFPAIDGNGFEYPPRLNRLLIKTEQSELYNVEGELTLNESPLDPIADLPVKNIVNMQLEIGSSSSAGEFVKEVAPEELAGYYHQRSDDLDALLGG